MIVLSLYNPRPQDVVDRTRENQVKFNLCLPFQKMQQFCVLLRHLTSKSLTNVSGQLRKLHSTGLCLKERNGWNLGKLNHVAVVTPSLDKSAKLYKDVLKASVSGKQPMPEHGVTTVFVDLGTAKIELLQPLGEKSPVQSFLNKNKAGGMHHICLEVDNIHEAIKDLKAKNIRILSEEPKIGAHGKLVVFLHPKDCDGVLVELEEA